MKYILIFIAIIALGGCVTTKPDPIPVKKYKFVRMVEHDKDSSTKINEVLVK